LPLATEKRFRYDKYTNEKTVSNGNCWSSAGEFPQGLLR